MLFSLWFWQAVRVNDHRCTWMKGIQTQASDFMRGGLFPIRRHCQGEVLWRTRLQAVVSVRAPLPGRLWA